MTEPRDPDFDGVDKLVKSYMDRETARTDATSLLSRIQSGGPRRVEPAREALPAPGWADAPWSPPFAWSAVMVLAVLFTFFGVRYLGPATANAASILRGVRSAHSQGVDRCYRVQYAPDPRYWRVANKLEGPSESVLWTRGDRFWADCSIAEIKLAVGRDTDGGLWVSPSRTKGIRFPDDDAQLPKDVATICKINAMTFPKLVDDVLADFDLRAVAPSSGSKEATSLVWASLKPTRTHPMISSAMLEIGAEDHVLIRLVLWTVRDGRPNGTVTFTLLESAPQGDEQYRLDSHLDPDAKVEIQSFRPGRTTNQDSPR